jgi:hypothetical protein
LTIEFSSNTNDEKIAMLNRGLPAHFILSGRIPGRHWSRRDKVTARSWKEVPSSRRGAEARDLA